MSAMPILEYLLRGVKLEQARQSPEAVRPRLQVTSTVLQKLGLS